MKILNNVIAIILMLVLVSAGTVLSQESRESRESEEVTIHTPELNIELQSREAALRTGPALVPAIITPYSAPADRVMQRGMPGRDQDAGKLSEAGWGDQISVLTWGGVNLTHPHMTSDGAGNLYIVTQTEFSNSNELDILRSTDGGNSWEFLFYLFMEDASASQDQLLMQQYVHNRIEASGGAEYEYLLEKVSEAERIPVIVQFDIPFTPEGMLDEAGRQQQRQQIQNVTEALLGAMVARNITAVKTYSYVPYIAMQVDEDALLYLMDSPYVKDIVEDKPVPPGLMDSIPLIGADDAWSMGYTGDGYVVAILDTGVDLDHPFFDGKLIDGACFSSNFSGHSATTLCPDGSEEQYGTEAGDDCNTSISGCGHGTHVAGIAAGDGTSPQGNISGVAVDADIITVQVFSEFNDASICWPASSPCVLSYVSDQLSALEWIYDIRNDYNIASVNMSLGGGQHTSPCDTDTRKTAIDNLRSANIATVIASGNNGFTNALSAPACISTSISVGSTTKSDVVSSFSNSATFLDLLAPGSSIYSAVPGGGFASFNGTSMAAPHVAGAWAVVRESSPGMNVAGVLQTLSDTGVPILDTRNSITKPRIQVDEAVGGAPLVSGTHLPSITFANGYLFVAHHRDNLQNRVYRYNLSSGTGEYLTLPAPNTDIHRMRIISDGDEFYPAGAWIYAAYIHENSSGNYEIYFTRSTSNGDSWMIPQLLGTTKPSYYQGILDVGLDWGSGGGMFLSYIGTDANDNRILVRRSGDFGGSWTDPVIIDSSTLGKAGPSVAVHGDNVLMAYQRPWSTTAPDDVIRGIYSVDAGESWTLFSIDGTTTENRMPWVSHDGSGNFYVTYNINENIYARVAEGPVVNTPRELISSGVDAHDAMFTAVSGLKGAGNSGAAAAWSAAVSGGTDLNIYGNRYGEPDETNPEIVVTPSSFEETVDSGESILRTLTIENVGDGVLTFSLSAVETTPSGIFHAVSQNRPGTSNPLSALGGRNHVYSGSAPVGPASVRSPEGLASLVTGGNELLWTGGQSLPDGDGVVRYGHAQCSDDPSSFYVISGVNEALSVTNKVWRYNAVTNQWIELAAIPTGQEGMSALCHSGYIYAIGGGGTNQFYIYDIAANSWSPAPALPRNVWGAAVGVHNGYIYMIGGDNDFSFGNTSNQVDIYDINAGSWVGTGSPMPTAAVTAGFVQAGQYLYIVGGWNDDSPVQNVDQTQRYDMGSDTWQVGPTFSSARADMPLAITESHLYAIGGDAPGGGAFDPTNVVEKLDHTAWPGGNWETTTALPGPLTAHKGGFCTVEFTGGEIWSVGGFTGAAVVGTNQYEPTEGCFIHGVQWLSIDPTHGSAAPGSSQMIDITFNATALQPGVYNADILISSNDPITPVITVPIQLTVDEPGTPEIVVTPDSFEETLGVDETSTQTMNISNIGDGNLNFNISWFEVDALPAMFSGGINNEYRRQGEVPLPDMSGWSQEISPAAGEMMLHTPQDIETWKVSPLSSVAPNILILTSDIDPAVPDDVKVDLISTGLFEDENIDITDNPSDLTLEFLMGYDAVLMYTNLNFADPVHIGDVLKDYVDMGGGVVMATYAYSAPWAIQGGILNANYSPFIPGPTQSVAGEIDMDSLTDPDHPIFDNIENAPQYFTNPNFSNPELNTGGILLASDIDGNRVVAQNPSGKVVGLVIFPLTNYENQGNFEARLLIANALYYVHSPVSWLSVAPSIGTVSPGGSMNLDVNFNASGLEPGVYNAEINIGSNDPAHPVVTVPAQLTVTDDTVTWDFAAGLVVTDDNDFSQTLTFGTAPDATEGFDPQYDQFAPPPPPPGAFDARFRHLGEDYFKFFQPTTTEVTTWLTLFQFSTDGDPVTLSWNPGEFAHIEGSFRLIDTFGGDLVNVDMRDVTSYTVENPGITQLYVVHALLQTIEISYTDHWEMVGLPVEVEDAHYQSLFTDAMPNTLFGFSGGTYIGAEELEMGAGYWLRFTASGTESITGMPVDAIGLSLDEDWNLIAGISCPVPLSEVVDAGGIIIPGTLFGWDEGYFESDVIEPGEGYWIKTSATGDISLSCSGPAGDLIANKGTGSAMAGDGVITSQFDRLEIGTNTGGTSNLYFGGILPEGSIRESYSMPPLPPQGAFDVRFSGNWYLIEETSGEIMIQAIDRHYPLSVMFETAEGNGEAKYILKEMRGEEVIEEHILETGIEITLSNADINRLQLMMYDGEADLPREYGLSQNFPNPFNPVTTIQYQLPEPADVRLEIYNTLGQRVRVLVSEAQEPGYYSIEWNGRNDAGQPVASGVYLYRIQAGDFTRTMKLVFMK